MSKIQVTRRGGTEAQWTAQRLCVVLGVGLLITAAGCGDATCPGGSKSVDGQCVPSAECGEGEKRRGGACVRESGASAEQDGAAGGSAPTDAEKDSGPPDVQQPKPDGGRPAEDAGGLDMVDATTADGGATETIPDAATEPGMAPEACGDLECGAHGTCEAVGDEARCVCAAGYAGELCDVCASDFGLAGETCVPACEADAAPACGSKGACEVVEGVAQCTCVHPAAGTTCEGCADGFVQEADGSCTPDCGECPENQSCEPTAPGQRACVCVAGFADCDESVANGCEISLSDHAGNCGSCGYSCASGIECATSACVSRLTQLTSSINAALALTSDGDVLASGRAGFLLRDGGDSRTFVAVPLDKASAITANVTHACMLRKDGSGATCWGTNTDHALGSEDLTARRADLAVVGARAISAGVRHTCLVDSEGVVYCWGGGLSGQLGDGVTRGREFTGRTFAETLSGRLSVRYVEDAVDVQAGEYLNCALTASGLVHCWGSADSAVYAPELVRGADGQPLQDAIELRIGQKHACALRETGAVVCWGEDLRGQLGSDEAPTGRNRFVTVGLEDVVDLTVGGYHSCAIVEGGRAYCWGDNNQGQLGSGDLAISTTPFPVLMVGLDRARSIHSGSGAVSTCMQLSNGGVYCWGFNFYGQLGLGPVGAAVVTPTEVTMWP